MVTYVKSNGTYNNASVLVNNVTTTKVTYNAANNYKAIILNSNMTGFVRCLVDQTSREFLNSNISKITGGGAAASGLIRMCAWHNLNEMVRDAKIRAVDYKNVIISNIPSETLDAIYDFQISFLATCLGYISNSTAARTEAFDFIMQQLTTIQEKSGGR